MILRDRDADGSSGNGLEERLWVLQDANFNVTALVNGSGTVVERYAYDSFGKVTYMNASWTTIGSSAYGWQYLHQGGRLDASSSLYYFRNRDYSPTLGRWATMDPIGYRGASTELYGYVQNNPMNKFDPLGLKSCGPNVTEWFLKEIQQFYDAGLELRKQADAINKDVVKMPYEPGSRGFGGSVAISQTLTVLKGYARLARLADYKSRNDEKVEPFDYSGCPDSEPETVTLCGTCVTTNQLGNFIFGVIAVATDQVSLSRQYGRGELEWIKGKPKEDWIKAPWKESTFDMGVEFATMLKKNGKMPDLCDFMKSHTKIADFEKHCTGLTPCKSVHKGPNTDMKREPLTGADGNK